MRSTRGLGVAAVALAACLAPGAALLPAAAPRAGAARRAAQAPPESASDRIARSVVKIYTTYRQPDYYQPWQMTAEGSLSGSGCVIEGGRILTNAHVVADSVFVQVRKSGDPAKHTAQVEFVGNDTELAVLRVPDPSFFEDTPALPLGDLPLRRDKLEVYGYPEGGDELSVTEGVVSRVEVTEYAHSGRSLLAFQTDAAINPGSSGGPVVKDGRIAGVTFQIMTDAQNVGYAVPAPLVARFLEDVRDGTYDGVPDLGIRWDTLENRAKREYLGMKPDVTGIRVSRLIHESSAWGLLEGGDILLSVDGTPVADDATVAFRRGERLLFTHLVDRLQVGQRTRLGLVREGKPITVAVPLKPPSGLVPGPFYGVRPSYYVFAGLVFTPLTRNYIDNWQDYGDVPTELKSLLEAGFPSPERRQAIVISHVLADAVNEGYHEWGSLVVAAINRRRIGSLRDVIEAFRDPLGRFHVLETEPGWLIVLDAAEAERASPSILARYGLPADRSPDLREAVR